MTTGKESLRDRLRNHGLTDDGDFLCSRFKAALLHRIADHVDALTEKLETYDRQSHNRDATIQEMIEGAERRFGAFKTGWEGSNQARAQSLVDHQRRIAALENQLNLALPCWRTVEAATPEPVTSTAQPIPKPDYRSILCQSCGSIRDIPNDPPDPTRAIAERCWDELKRCGMCGEAQAQIARFKDDYRDKAVTRIQAAVDEGISFHDSEAHEDCKRLIEERNTLTAERDKLIDECNQWQEGCTDLTAERDRLKAESDSLNETLERYDADQRRIIEALEGEALEDETVPVTVERIVAERDRERDRLKAKIKLVKIDRNQVLKDGQTIQTDWRKVVDERDRLKGELDKLIDAHQELGGEHDRLQEDAEKWKAHADNLLRDKIKLQQPTPIDEKELDLVAQDVYGRTSIMETEIPLIRHALRSIAGRPLTAKPVDDAEIERVAKNIWQQTPDEGHTFSGVKDGIMDALRSIAGRPLAGTPIDDAELERVADELVTDFYRIGYLTKSEEPQTRHVVTNALRTVASRPLLAVTAKEIAAEITNHDGAAGMATAIMTLLRSRCRVVPGEDEIGDWWRWAQARTINMDEWKKRVMRLLTAPASGGDADG